MGTGILDVSIELLQEFLLIPDGMTIDDVIIDKERNKMRIFVKHADIPQVGPGDWLPRVNMRLATVLVEPRTILEGWDVSDGGPFESAMKGE